MSIDQPILEKLLEADPIIEVNDDHYHRYGYECIFCEVFSEYKSEFKHSDDCAFIQLQTAMEKP